MPLNFRRVMLTHLAIVVLSAVTTRSAVAQCRQAGVGRMDVRSSLQLPENVHYLSHFGITIAPSDSLVPVTDTSMCRKAAEAIAGYTQVPFDSFAIVLVRVGAHFVADADRSMAAFRTIFDLQ